MSFEVDDHEMNIFSQDVRRVIGTPSGSPLETTSNVSTDTGIQVDTQSTTTSITQLAETPLLDSAREGYNNVEIQALEAELDNIISDVRSKIPLAQPTRDQLNLNYNVMNQFDQGTNLLSVHQRLNVQIYEPAMASWKQLRNLQSKKVQLEMRSTFYSHLIEEGCFPDWTVSFNPPIGLLNTQ